MYPKYFGLTEPSFSIAPDPHFLYLSAQHKEALAHLLYGAGESGGFVLLTGEVGTGKTTVCRAFLEQLPAGVEVALILNPALTATELLLTICDELHIAVPPGEISQKVLLDRLNDHLLEAHGQGRRPVLIIDEAQNLRPRVLEQVRLLTNLETTKHKLLQIFLIGQPELRDMLARDNMRQINQRITARVHLRPFTLAETGRYIEHRVAVAGVDRPLFSATAIRQIHLSSGGVPRLINILCDRALLGACVSRVSQVTPAIVKRAAREVEGENQPVAAGSLSRLLLVAALAFLLALLGGWLGYQWLSPHRSQPLASLLQQGLSWPQLSQPLAGLFQERLSWPWAGMPPVSDPRLSPALQEPTREPPRDTTQEPAPRVPEPTSATPDGDLEAQSMSAPPEPLTSATPVAPEETATPVPSEESGAADVRPEAPSAERSTQPGAQSPRPRTTAVESAESVEPVERVEPVEPLEPADEASVTVPAGAPIDPAPGRPSDPAASTAALPRIAMSSLEPAAIQGTLARIAMTETTALGLLLRHWGHASADRPETDLCAWIETLSEPLACARALGTLEDLRLINRPVLLRVKGVDETPRFVLVSALDAAFATLDQPNGRELMPLAGLESIWSGDYLLVWQIVPTKTGIVGPTESGEAVSWLRGLMARVPGANLQDLESRYYDTRLTRVVRAFQASRGLHTDGIVGPLTLVQLQDAADLPGIPRLASRAPAQEASAPREQP